jgi:hypothetical protein
MIELSSNKSYIAIVHFHIISFFQIILDELVIIQIDIFWGKYFIEAQVRVLENSMISSFNLVGTDS